MWVYFVVGGGDDLGKPEISPFLGLAEFDILNSRKSMDQQEDSLLGIPKWLRFVGSI